MKNYNVAAIDIGSNAVRLLISSIKNSKGAYTVQKEIMLRVPIRLGQDAFMYGKIEETKFKNLVRLMKSYKHLMKIYDVKLYRACATSAMRDALNSEDLVKEIYDKTQIYIEVISGTEEAGILYESHFADKLDKNLNHIYVDVGGGSTEISLIVNGDLKESKSYEIGTVRLLNNKVKEKEWEKLTTNLKNIKVQWEIENIIGSGGNILKLNKLINNDQSGHINVGDLLNFYNEIEPLDPDQLMEIYNLKSDRADVITHAAKIYMEVALHLGCTNILVPTIGLTDGITHLLLEEWKKENKI